MTKKDQIILDNLKGSIFDLRINDYPPIIHNVSDGEVVMFIIWGFGDDRNYSDQGIMFKWNSNYHIETNAVFLDLSNIHLGWQDVFNPDYNLYNYIKENRKS